MLQLILFLSHVPTLVIGPLLLWVLCLDSGEVMLSEVQLADSTISPETVHLQPKQIDYILHKVILYSIHIMEILVM